MPLKIATSYKITFLKRNSLRREGEFCQMHRRDAPHHLVRGPDGEGLNQKLKDKSIMGAEQDQIQTSSPVCVAEQEQVQNWQR